jgi:ankyrin repeat protein
MLPSLLRKVIAALLAAGARAELRNKDGWTPFHLACRAGSKAIVSRLWMANPDAAVQPSNTRRTPLMTAALHGHVDVVTVCLPRI